MSAIVAAPYTVKLQHFEGPFDLLLYFIERDELNIYDIPIAKITQEFLEYIHQLKSLNIEVASEFILVAATLMRIKAKMLLPRKEINEAGQEIDPRQELVNKLIEYKKFKHILEELKQLEALRALQFLRGNAQAEVLRAYETLGREMEMENLSLYKLMRVFHKVLARFEQRTHEIVHQVVKLPYTIIQERQTILEFLNDANNDSDSLTFEFVFGCCDNRIHAIFRFLALLELIQEQLVAIVIGEGFNNAWLKIQEEAILDEI